MRRVTLQQSELVDITPVRQHILEDYPNESVGAMTNNQYYRLNNTSANKENSFSVSPTEWMEVQSKGEIQFLVHSHTINPEVRREHDMDPATPSTKDFKVQQQMDVPWAIFATDGENITPPVVFPLERDAELIGRDFVFYVNDCFTVVADYYHQVLGIDLKGHPDGMEWERGVVDGFYMKHAVEYGFEEVELEDFADLQEHDLIVMGIKGEQNHGGIYIGNGLVLHHLSGRKSEKIPLNKLMSFITNVLRYRK